MDQVFVTNTNPFLHTDRYDGNDYVFPPGEKVLISVTAARLFFGFQNPDKTEALVRQGWANEVPGQDPLDGPKKLAKFVFTRGVMVEEPVEASAPAPVPEEAAQA